MSNEEQKSTTVYRGTINRAIMADYLRAENNLEAATEAFWEQHKKMWDAITAKLNLDPDRDHHLNRLTRQVFEDVPVEELEESALAESENGAKEE